MSAPHAPADPTHVGTVVIGGGQAGLVTGYRLQRRSEDFVILEQHQEVGDAWRRRWSSLRLFSSPRASWLPGLRMRGGGALSKDGFADYLESYADTLGLPVRTGVRVHRLGRSGSGFRLETSAGELRAERVVVATGPFQSPRIPAVADQLDPAVVAMHSSSYRDPGQLHGVVLVVGAASSGTELAWESARSGHPTILAGRDPGEVPFDIDGPLASVLAPAVTQTLHRVTTLRTPWGRAQAEHFASHGYPVFRRKRRDLAAAGVRLVGRIESAVDGRLVVDGEPIDADTVLWCTGYRRDYGWIDLPVTGPRGEVVHRRGLVDGVPGLAFVGLPYQWSAVSSSLGGVGHDARFVVDRLLRDRDDSSAARDAVDEPFDRRPVAVQPVEPPQVA